MSFNTVDRLIKRVDEIYSRYNDVIRDEDKPTFKNLFGLIKKTSKSVLDGISIDELNELERKIETLLDQKYGFYRSVRTMPEVTAVPTILRKYKFFVSDIMQKYKRYKRRFIREYEDGDISKEELHKKLMKLETEKKNVLEEAKSHVRKALHMEKQNYTKITEPALKKSLGKVKKLKQVIEKRQKEKDNTNTDNETFFKKHKKVIIIVLLILIGIITAFAIYFYRKKKIRDKLDKDMKQLQKKFQI